ncbi:unnamed protein product [Cercospora beticola]|nr:unnamed protein product [Cercospora beticola]
MFLATYKQSLLEYIAFTDEVQMIVERNATDKRSVRVLWFFTQHPMQWTTYGGKGMTSSDCRFVDFAVNMGRCLVNLSPLLSASITQFRMEQLGGLEPLNLDQALPFSDEIVGLNAQRRGIALRTDRFPEDRHLRDVARSISQERAESIGKVDFEQTKINWQSRRARERSRQEGDRNMGKDLNPASCEQRALTRISNRYLNKDDPSMTASAISTRARKARETPAQRETRLSKGRVRAKAHAVKKQQEYDDALGAQGIENGGSGGKKTTVAMLASRAKRAKETPGQREARLEKGREYKRAKRVKEKQQKEDARKAKDSETSNPTDKDDDTVLDESAQEMEEQAKCMPKTPAATSHPVFVGTRSSEELWGLIEADGALLNAITLALLDEWEKSRGTADIDRALPLLSTGLPRLARPGVLQYQASRKGQQVFGQAMPQFLAWTPVLRRSQYNLVFNNMTVAIDDGLDLDNPHTLRHAAAVEPDNLADLAFLFASSSYLNRGKTLKGGEQLNHREAAMRVFSDSDAGRRINPPQSEKIHAILTAKAPLKIKFLVHGPFPVRCQDVGDDGIKKLLVAAQQFGQRWGSRGITDHYTGPNSIWQAYVDTGAQIRFTELIQGIADRTGLPAFVDERYATMKGTLSVDDDSEIVQTIMWRFELGRNHNIDQSGDVKDCGAPVCKFRLHDGAREYLGDMADILWLKMKFGGSEKEYAIGPE